MVYCVKCGTKNPDEAKKCSQCGASLYSLTEVEHAKRKNDECFGTHVGAEPHERVEKECFGIPRGGAVVGLAIGIIIVLAGLSLLLKELLHIFVPWWPFVIIIFGVLVIIGAIYGLRSRH